MKIWKMALRNVGRNKRRTLITIAATSFALAMMILFTGLMNGMLYDMEHNAIALQTAHIQIHALGYREDPTIYKRIENHQALLTKLDQAGYQATGRLLGSGLIASGTSSAGSLIMGIDPAAEAQVTEIHRHLLKGKWLDKSDALGVVIGRKMAKTLNVNIGDELIFVSQAADGSLANELFSVRGILKTISEVVDRGGLFMIDGSFREVMALEEGVHQIALIIPEDEDLLTATQKVESLSKGLEVRTWRELMPALSQMLEMTGVSLGVMFVIVYFVIGMVILNATLMAVFERVREFGVMKAIGISPLAVLALILAEAVIQTIMAIIGGLAIGVPISLYLENHGIDLTHFADSTAFAGVAIDPIWRSITNLDSIIQPVIFLIVLSMLAVIYPGIKAAVIQPIKAIQHR